MTAKHRLTAFVTGHVQGVGFRWWTKSQAKELGLAGSATNLDDGRVLIVAEGDEGATGELLLRLTETTSRTNRPGRVDAVVDQWGEPRGEEGFVER